MPRPPPKSICEMVWPSARSVWTNSARIRNAVSIRLRSVIWLPICMSVPVPSIAGTRARDRNAELVLGLAGGDLGVGAGIDVRIGAHRDSRGRSGLDGEPRQ